MGTPPTARAAFADAPPPRRAGIADAAAGRVAAAVLVARSASGRGGTTS
jgi:hypothetical protein